ncbi:hypothetical protein J8J14_12115 [Roseomonas sp. SSH11]|uniref:Cellulase n=1 Tax=Pararoseomonas baculiformis TaxID=2820812 RepID=A0ABS4AER7_9PROT|nr:hypothetical protein [Pararoseomonas baculiformis]MBP0445521.1 hypothetical protein [Pararoseomonas baculiformis]
MSASERRSLPRRAALAVPLLLARPAGAEPGWAGLAADALAPIRHAAAAADGPALLKSFTTEGREDFDRVHAEVAFTYDNALAGLALLAGGERGLALRIAEALRLAQEQDRHWQDGRLRNAYPAGRVFAEAPRSIRPPGWWDAARGQWLEDGYQAGSAAGPIAFAMLLWTALGDPPFRHAAGRAADWLERLRGPRGFRGGTIGHEPAPDALPWVSTEQNLDLAVAFGRLGRGDAAAHAAGFVRSMWMEAEGRFAMGLAPDGAVNRGSALDANLWPALAWPGQGLERALDWVLSRHGLPSGAPPAEMQGLDFNDDRDGIWMEGTAQAALLLRRLGRGALAARFANTIARHRRPDGWIAAASIPWLTTGLGTGLRPGMADFLYPARGHLAANAWAALAALDVSPFG